MLEVRHLTKTFPGPVAALRDINLSAEKGMFGLLGPNGAGKTTLMRILAGLLEPSSGRVVFDGLDVTENPELIWMRLGYLPQSFGFYPDLSGEKTLRFFLDLKGVNAPGGLPALCSELLDRVNLGDVAGRKVKYYSGGMKQRLGIAQAIAGNPDLIIVDEPTAGLDPEERLRFYQLLAELADERVILLSTHIVDDVATLCSRFAVIRDGRLVATTTPDAARARISGSVFEGTTTREELSELSQSHRVVQAYLVEGRLRVRLFVPDDNPPSRFRSAEPSLADAYLLMMQGCV